MYAALIEDHPAVWRWLLKNSSKSRPQTLPPYVQADLIDSTVWPKRAI